MTVQFFLQHTTTQPPQLHVNGLKRECRALILPSMLFLHLHSDRKHVLQCLGTLCKYLLPGLLPAVQGV